MGVFNELKEYFKQRKIQKKEKSEYNKANRQMKNDIEKAKKYLSSFKFKFQVKNENNEDVVRIIDEHNLEYCFLPKIWKLLDNATKMAVMIKFSEKNNSRPLKLEDFRVPDKTEKQEDRMYHLYTLFSGETCFLLDYDIEKLNNTSYVIETILAHDDIIKEDIFIKRSKDYKSIFDFKSIDELKYMINTREELFATYFPDALNKNKELLLKTIKKYEINIEDRASYRLYDVFGNVAYYAKEAEGISNLLEVFKNAFLNMQKEEFAIFGSPENLKKQTIKFVYDIYHPEKDIDFQKVIEHFMPMKEYNYDESLFPYIDLNNLDNKKDMLL